MHDAAMHMTDSPNHHSISGQLADDRLVLSVAEAGARLGLSRAFAYELVARGELPVVRFGRRIVVPKVALLELLSGAHWADRPSRPMLSIGKLVAGAEDYYLSMVAGGKEEYYSGAGESPGTWLGAGTDDLGLAGEVSPEALAAIVAGISPRTGADLGLMRRSDTRVSGFDLTFSAPKSVSLLYALGSPVHSAAVRAAHDQAVSRPALSRLRAGPGPDMKWVFRFTRPRPSASLARVFFNIFEK